jgi:hypothetical protein
MTPKSYTELDVENWHAMYIRKILSVYCTREFPAKWKITGTVLVLQRDFYLRDYFHELYVTALCTSKFVPAFLWS